MKMETTINLRNQFDEDTVKNDTTVMLKRSRKNCTKYTKEKEEVLLECCFRSPLMTEESICVLALSLSSRLVYTSRTLPGSIHSLIMHFTVK